MIEGNSIVYYLGKWLAFGQPLPNWATGQDVFMNQVLYAAWIGLLVTALNLLPVGQLDGGHTVYALFGKKARYANLATLGLMGLFALAGLPFVQELIPVIRSRGLHRLVHLALSDHGNDRRGTPAPIRTN
jgi:membrane-associated protease RseP (regulator of RpoE activity)